MIILLSESKTDYVQLFSTIRRDSTFSRTVEIQQHFCSWSIFYVKSLFVLVFDDQIHY